MAATTTITVARVITTDMSIAPVGFLGPAGRPAPATFDTRGTGTRIGRPGGDIRIPTMEARPLGYGFAFSPTKVHTGEEELGPRSVASFVT